MLERVLLAFRTSSWRAEPGGSLTADQGSSLQANHSQVPAVSPYDPPLCEMWARHLRIRSARDEGELAKLIWSGEKPGPDHLDLKRLKSKSPRTHEVLSNIWQWEVKRNGRRKGLTIRHSSTRLWTFYDPQPKEVREKQTNKMRLYDGAISNAFSQVTVTAG